MLGNAQFESIVLIVLDICCDLKCMNECGQCYRVHAIEHSYAEFATIRINSTILQSGATPLMVASEPGHLPVVKTLLKHKATIGLKDEVRNEHFLNIPCNLTSGKLSM